MQADEEREHALKFYRTSSTGVAACRSSDRGAGTDFGSVLERSSGPPAERDVSAAIDAVRDGRHAG